MEGSGLVAKMQGLGVGQTTRARPTRSAGQSKKRAPDDGKQTKPQKRAKTVAPVQDLPLNQIPQEILNIYVFGGGSSGELGLGPFPTDTVKDPTLVVRPVLNTLLSQSNIVQVSVGGIHCAALTSDGQIMTWGANDSNTLGRTSAWSPDENAEDDDEPELNPLEATPALIPRENFVDAPADIRFVQVVATDNATFALTEHGEVWGWGTFRGNNGAFGFLKSMIRDVSDPEDPSTEELVAVAPVRIPGLPPKIKTLVGASNHILVLTHSGDVYGWGAGTQNELGRRFGSLKAEARFNSLEPQHLATPRHKIARVFAGYHHSFAVNGDGEVWAWGLNNYGQTGVPVTRGQRSGMGTISVIAPTRVKALQGHKIVCVAAGLHHSIACAEDGTVLVWGRCDDGQMGIDLTTVSGDDVQRDSRGRPTELSVPTVVPDLSAKVVAAGIDCCFAVTAEGHAYSWGFSSDFRTGLGTDDTVERPKCIGKAVKDKLVSWAGCGGAFAVLAGPVDE